MFRKLLCLLLLFLLKLPVAQAQQPLERARQSSYFTKIFRLTDAQTRHLYEQGLGAVEPAFFTQLVDSFATDKTAGPPRKQPLGYYLVAHTEGPQLVYWLLSETDRQVIVVDNQVDLTVLVRDTLGHPLGAGARVQVRKRPVPYDAATGTFRRAGGVRAGLLALTVGGRTTYHPITGPGSNRRRGAWNYARRLGHRALYGFPLGYASRAVKKLVRDLHRASDINTGLVGLLRSPFNEDVREERRDHRKNHREERWEKRWTGYVALSQPRYRPHGDTLRLKARILHQKSGHPYTGPVVLRLSGYYGQPMRRLAVLQPVRPGSYELVLPLPDSLNLRVDSDAQLLLETLQGKPLGGTRFRVADYELANTHYALRLAHAAHRLGQAQAIYLRGTDANELSLLDARLRLEVYPTGPPGAFAEPQLFVPDTLFTWRQPLDALGETRVNVPESSFPAADLAYTVRATFLNADNERHEETARAERHADPGELRLELQADSLLLRYEWAGQAAGPHRATLTVRGSATGGPPVALATYRLTLPARVLLDPRATAYEVSDSAQRHTELVLNEANAAVALHAERTVDSLHLRLDNPRHLPVYYFLYQGNRLVRRGQGPELALAIRTTKAAPWYVSLHYWWGGALRSSESGVALAQHQLTVRAEQPDVAYPGQRLALRYTVTDVAGRPVPDADLTSYAYTSKFDRPEAPEAAPFDQPMTGRVSRRRFGLGAGFENDAAKGATQLLPWAAWRGRLGLDSLRFYQFLYPEGGFFYDYRPAPSGLTQLAPFVLDHGQEVPLIAIYLDGLPVWIHDVNAPEAYAVLAAAGLHRLSLRTAEHLLTLPDIFLCTGQKLTLSVDMNAICAGLKLEKRGPLKPYERLELARSLVLFERGESETHWDTHSSGEAGPLVLGQGLHWQQVRWNYGSSSWLGGPFRPDSVALRRADGLRLAFMPEPMYHYRFRPGQTRLRSASADDFGSLGGSGYGGGWAATGRAEGLTDIQLARLRTGQNWLSHINRALLPLGDFAATPAQVLASLQPLPPRQPSLRQRLGPASTARGEGRLVVRLPGWSLADDDRFGKSLLFSKRPGYSTAVSWVQVTPATKLARPMRYVSGLRAIEGLVPGSYRLVLLLADSSILTPAAPVLIRPNGTTYVQLLAAAYQPVGPRSRAAFQQLQRDLAPLPSPQVLPKRRLMRVQTPARVPKSWDTVVGRVVDSSTQQGVAGLTVLVEGTTLGTATAADGQFELAVSNQTATLVFSSVGYATRRLAATFGEPMLVTMHAEVMELEEVVITGSEPRMSRQMMTSAVSVITSSSLMSRVAGVAIAGESGAGSRIVVRGTSTLAGATAPLIIVDGLPMSLAIKDLDPASILSMKTLSAAAAVGIYGSQASGGVVIITTKGGLKLLPGAVVGLAGLPDAGGSDPRLALRRNFRDYAWWRPTLVTDAQGQARTTVVLPDDVTGWDTFALVSDNHGRLGTATARLRAFKALRAELAVPRFLVAGDQTRVLGKTLNYLPDTAAATTSFRVNDGAARTQAHRVVTAVLDTLTVTAPATGADSIQLTFGLRQPNGYQDGEQRTVAIVPAGTRETVGTFALITAADTTLTLPVSPGLGEVHIRLEADALPILLREIEHLSSYAYLCNEQMASKLLGLLLNQRIMGLQNQPFTQEKNIRYLIRRLLAGRHQPDGLWGTWPQAVPSPWATLHVLDALLAAEKQGYPVKYDQQAIRNYLLGELDEAFAEVRSRGYFQLADDRLRLLQMLHRLDAPLDYATYLGRLNRAASVVRGPQPLDRALAITEFRQQLKLPVQLDTLARYRFVTQLGGLFYADTVHGASYYQYVMAGRMATTLQAYRILRAAGGHAAELLRLRTSLLNQRPTGYWASTYETAQILETIGPDLLPAGATSIQPIVRLLGGVGVAPAPPLVLPYVATRPASAGPLTLHKQGGLPVYATAYQIRWNPAPVAKAAPFTVSSTLAGQRGSAVRLRAGQPTDLVVTVDVRAESRYVLLEIPIPAGCSYAPHAAPSAHETHREYLRHQTGIFLDYLPAGRHTFRVALQPRYAGRYTLNPAKAELIYFPTRFGREGSKRVTVE